MKLLIQINHINNLRYIYMNVAMSRRATKFYIHLTTQHMKCEVFIIEQNLYKFQNYFKSYQDDVYDLGLDN